MLNFGVGTKREYIYIYKMSQTNNYYLYSHLTISVVFVVMLVVVVHTVWSTTKKLEAFNTNPFVITRAHASRIQPTCVFMVNINFSPGAVASVAWKKYCQRHGYDFVELDDPSYDDASLGVAWWRIRAVQELFAIEKYDVIMHVDADTVPITLDVSIQDHMSRSKRSETILWVSQDNIAGDNPYFESINFGVFIIKNSERNLQMLRDVWEERYSRTNWPREQGAIQDWLVKNVKSQQEWDTYFHVSRYGDWQCFGIEGPANARTGNFTNSVDYLVNVMMPTTNAWIFHAVGVGSRSRDDQTTMLRAINEELNV